MIIRPLEKGLQRYNLKEHAHLRWTKVSKLGVKVGNTIGFSCPGVGSR